MGKTLDTYQKDKKIIFLPSKGLIALFSEASFVELVGNFVIIPFIHKNRLEIFLSTTYNGKNPRYLSRYLYSFSCPAKALLRYFQRLVCRVSGEFSDIHAGLETSRALLNVSQVHVRTQNASK